MQQSDDSSLYQVGTAQLFLGLVAEARGEGGFLRTGLTIERAREAMRQLTMTESSALGGGLGEIPFSAVSVPYFLHQTCLSATALLSSQVSQRAMSMNHDNEMTLLIR